MLDDEQDISQTSMIDKGKNKEFEEFDNNSVELLDESEAVYPPLTDDVEETRRVEKNLRRWEVAERKRRKAARESQSHSGGPSLVSDVTRRASLLFSGRKGRQHSLSTLGNHAALQSQDSIDGVPLTQVPRLVSTPSPTPENDLDPFANPHSREGSVSPFDDVYAARDSSSSLSPSLNKPARAKSTENQRTRKPPSPPRPLNLPPPRSPPPILQVDEEGNDISTAKEDVRWWHDWLCGCGEGLDRGGDYQAGYTNPLE